MLAEYVIPYDAWSDWQAIDNNNWAVEFPYQPNAKFRMSHNGDTLFIEFAVAETYTGAATEADNGPVWLDSCVEFFVSFDEKGYYNLETNCIGAALMGFRKTKPEAQHATPEIMALIKRSGTYPRKTFEQIQGDNKWTIKLEIPKEAFFGHEFQTLRGLNATANVYKCGDNLKEAHFLSWSPIKTEKPNFHLPEFFGKIRFE